VGGDSRVHDFFTSRAVARSASCVALDWPFVVVPMLLMAVMLAREAADAKLAVQA